ncbi:MAG: prepilin-type N-terminal cleavage/methylation domain-containing protein [Planctomycetales bacterium]|nr:prepilin-type N-terminal cleavage/methylation domain-containing protein [Planctomycetales bacterium]
MRTRRDHPIRTGFTLIECVAVITMVGMLLSLSSVLLHRAFEAHRGTLVSYRQLQQVNSWCERLREDASQAIEADCDNHLTLTRDDGERIRYSVEQQRLVRSLLRDGKMLNQETCDTWPLAQVTWQVDHSGKLPLLEGQLEFAPTESMHAPIEWVARLPKTSNTR